MFQRLVVQARNEENPEPANGKGFKLPSLKAHEQGPYCVQIDPLEVELLDGRGA